MDWSILPQLVTNISANSIASSLILIASIVLLRAFVVRQIRGQAELLSDDRRRWIIRAKNAALIAIILGLVVIWSPKLHTFLLSITAFAVAIVIATKELILCISGSIIRASNRPFVVGDWIEVAGIRGEVIDTDLFSTIIQELGQKKSLYEFTGKTVALPNSLFLSQNVKNENFLKNYTFHEFTLTVEPAINPMDIKEQLESRLPPLMEAFKEVGERYLHLIEKKMGSDFPDPSPQILIHTTDFGKQVFTFKLFCPTQAAIGLEQRIAKDFFQIFYSLKQTEESKKETKAERPIT